MANSTADRLLLELILFWSGASAPQHKLLPVFATAVQARLTPELAAQVANNPANHAVVLRATIAELVQEGTFAPVIELLLGKQVAPSPPPSEPMVSRVGDGNFIIAGSTITGNINPVMSSQPRDRPREQPRATPAPSSTEGARIAPTAPEEPLTLIFESEGDHVRVSWESTVVGVRRGRFVPPFRGHDLAAVIRALDLLQHQSGSLDAADAERLHALELPLYSGLPIPATQRVVGQILFRALTADPESATAMQIAQSHARSTGAALQLRLRFPPDGIELSALPWELLWDQGPAPLLLERGLMASCTRHLDLAVALPPPRRRQGPLRILAITPHAGVEAAARERERAERAAAWAPLIASGEVAMDEISPATRRALSDHLHSAPRPDIVHFVGHGRYRDGQGWLVLDRPDGGWDRVPVGQLLPLFGDARLVMLCACEGATNGEGGLLTGVAPALSAAGVPAVVAMQLSIRAAAATRFSEVVYRALARGDSLQQAVMQARQALYVEERDAASWYVPTLTIRARDPGAFYLFEQ